MEIHKIFTSNIKPSSPTPDHLKTYKFSILDQTFSHFYVNSITFYLHTQPNSNNVDADATFYRLERLRMSLSDTLTRFYTFAGRIKDDLHIDCNDEGVYYVEARVNQRLSHLLMQPDDHLMDGLIPDNPISVDSSSGNYVMRIQVNVFNCSGMAICLCTSHKTIDATTYTTFMKAWAATARGSSKVIYPSFIPQSLFPQTPSLHYRWPPPPISTKGKFIRRRFVFDASSLVSLKNKFATSRVVAVSSLLWKCAMEAVYEAGHSSQNNPSVLALTIDIRRKMSPPLPQCTVGNFIWYVFPRCTVKSKLELKDCVDCVGKEIIKINSDFIEKIKGYEGFNKVSDSLKESWTLVESTGVDGCINLTSMCNMGLYEPDFGWGKPAWFFNGNPIDSRLVALADTRADGIEAFVALHEQEMAIFQRNPDVLAFTSLDPSPLKLCISSSRL